METGSSIPYSINNLQDRGTFFIGANEDIYEGQVVGENSRAGDLVVNLTKTKKLTNMRSAGADDKTKLVPPRRFTLEEALEYIQVTLEKIGVNKALRRAGIRQGDYVQIGELQFDYMDDDEHWID